MRWQDISRTCVVSPTVSGILSEQCVEILKLRRNHHYKVVIERWNVRRDNYSVLEEQCSSLSQKWVGFTRFKVKPTHLYKRKSIAPAAQIILSNASAHVLYFSPYRNWSLVWSRRSCSSVWLLLLIQITFSLVTRRCFKISQYIRKLSRTHKGINCTRELFIPQSHEIASPKPCPRLGPRSSLFGSIGWSLDWSKETYNIISPI